MAIAAKPIISIDLIVAIVGFVEESIEDRCCPLIRFDQICLGTCSNLG